MTTICIAQNLHDKRWSYGPPLLLKVLKFSGDGGEYATASAAKAAAFKDASVPRPVRFQLFPCGR